jgi:CBS domain-containing protein
MVQDRGSLAGILSGYQMREVPAEQWDTVTASQAMVPRSALHAATRELLISDVLLEMETEELLHMPVVENGRVVGIVARDRILGLLRQAGLLPARAQ